MTYPETMTAGQFRAWRRRMGFSLARAAEALGMSRAMVAYYQNGDHPVPRTVALACWALEHGAQAPSSRPRTATG